MAADAIYFGALRRRQTNATMTSIRDAVTERHVQKMLRDEFTAFAEALASKA
jgi:hypothetical protein